MPLSRAVDMFAFLVSRRDRAPEKRKVGGSTPPLTTRFWVSASALTCRNRRKRAKAAVNTAVSRTKIPTKNPTITVRYCDDPSRIVSAAPDLAAALGYDIEAALEE